MCTRISTLTRAFLAVLLLTLSPGVEVVVCLCVDHISAHVASVQDDCCTPASEPAGATIARGAGASDCDACIDVVLTGQPMPVVRVDAPAAFPALAQASLDFLPAAQAMRSASAPSSRYPVPLLSPAKACDILRI